MSKLVAFLKDETGATAIEYGLIAAGISVVIIASVNAIGSKLNSTFQLKFALIDGTAPMPPAAIWRPFATLPVCRLKPV
jgi:pilus assembly protein Flp/PilA